MTSEVHNIDCLELMRTLPDKCFQLAEMVFVRCFSKIECKLVFITDYHFFIFSFP